MKKDYDDMSYAERLEKRAVSCTPESAGSVCNYDGLSVQLQLLVKELNHQKLGKIITRQYEIIDDVNAVKRVIEICKQNEKQ